MDDTEFEELLARFDELVENDQEDEALDLLDGAEPADDDQRRSLVYLRASAHTAGGRLDDADRLLQEVADEPGFEDDQLHHSALVRRAVIASRQGRMDDADALLDEADPDQVGPLDVRFARDVLARQAMAEGDLDRMAALIDATHELGYVEEDLGAYRFSWVNDLIADGQLDAAEGLLARFPPSGEEGLFRWWLVRAAIYAQRGDASGAAASYRFALEYTTAPLLKRFAGGLAAQWLLAAGRAHEALALLNQVDTLAPADEPDLAALNLRLHALGLVGDVRRQHQVFEELAAAHTAAGLPFEGAAAAALAIARVNAAMDSGDPAIQELALEATLEPEGEQAKDPWAWVRCSYALSQFGHNDKAAAAAQHFEHDEAVANSFLGLLARSFVAIGKEDSALAEQLLAQASLLAPNSPTPVLMRSLALASLGRFDEAEADLAPFAEGLSAAPPGRLQLAQTWAVWASVAATLARAEKDPAERDAGFASHDRYLAQAEAVPEASDHPVARVLVAHAKATGLLARSQSVSGRLDEPYLRAARATLVEASASLQGLPDDHPIVISSAMLRATASFVLRDLDDAIPWLERALPSPIAAGSSLAEMLGWAYLQQGNATAALSTFERGLATASPGDRIGLLTGRSEALRRAGRAEEALAVAQQAVAENPASERARVEAGLAHRALGHLGAAADAFRPAFELAPRSDLAAEAVLGATEAMIEDGNAEAALAFLNRADVKPFVQHDSRVRTNKDAATARIKVEPAGPGSWFGYWFGRGASAGRRAAGVVLVVLLAAFIVYAVADVEDVPGFGWVRESTEWWQVLTPLLAVAVLFLLPVTSRFKVAGVELEQPIGASDADPPSSIGVGDVLDRVSSFLQVAATQAAPAPPR